MYSLLVMTISGSVLALFLMVLRYTVLRKMPSTVYYYAWLLVLLRFALPLPGLIPTTGDTANVTSESSARAVYSEMNAQENVNEYVPENIQVNTQENIQKVYEIEQNDVAKSVPAETSESQVAINAAETPEVTVSETAPKIPFSIDWKSPVLWLTIWAAGAVASMGITVFSYLRFSFKLKKNLIEPDSFTKSVYASIRGRKPALYFSYSARTPMLLGIFKPKIVLPLREYDEELLLNILRHELTHYRRFDMLYKWVTTALLSLHWFNPVAWVIRREFNRACELSCDEMLLRSMDRDEKQSYGNSLLLMAAQSPLPSAVVATSFATEKRNLKERLTQIMNYKKSGTRLLSTIIAVVLLTGCAVGAGPRSGNSTDEDISSEVTQVETSGSESENDIEIPVAPPKSEDGVVKVTTVDEFLVSIAPHTTVELAEGVYDLTKAFDYGKTSKSKYYSWNGLVDSDGNGAELIIQGVKDLTIRGAGIGKTSILAVDRSASVINFSGCTDLTISNLTAGHTVEPDPCNGAVLRIDNCPNTKVDSCGLYGCGTIGINGFSSEGLNVTNCDIYECSVSAVRATHCNNVFISGCDIHHHGTRTDNSIAHVLFDAFDSSGFTVYNCKIHDNRIEGLFYASNTDIVFFLSNEVTKNKINESAFYFEPCGGTVDGCQFKDNDCTNWYMPGERVKATNIDGNQLTPEMFTSMKLRDIKPETVVPSTATPTPGMKPKDVTPGTEVIVKTVDEFLEAIGPDRTIVLDGTNFNLSEAKNYGGTSTPFYRWEEVPDGYELIIKDVTNLTIKAKNTDPAATTLEALPRYADVLTFNNCYKVTVTGFTAGHTKGKGICSGGVLYFDNSEEIKVEKMRLYGCGDMGIDTFMSSNIDVINTEIYECTSGAVDCLASEGINFKDCNIHDVPSPALRFTECDNITWNGKKLEGEDLRYDVKPDGTLEGRVYN